MATDFRELKSRYDFARDYKDRWLGLYNQLYDYVIPNRNAFNVKWGYSDDGRPTTVQIWDNTAVTCANQRANDLHGLLLPEGRRWGKYSLDPHRYSQGFIDAKAPMMDEVNKNILFYLGESNLARIVASSNLDLVGGTAAIWVESQDDDRPLVFSSIPSVCLYTEYSNDDILNTCWYQVKMTGHTIAKTFPNYRGSKYAAIMGSPNEIYTVVYGQIKYTEDSFYLYATMQDDPFWPLWENEKPYNQIIIYRDRVRPGESDGRGIGLDMLPSIIDLNKIVKYDRQSLAFKAYPPMFVDTNSYFNPWQVKQWAGSNIPRSPSAKRNPVEFMPTPESPEPMERILDLRQIIKDAFNVDPLGTVEQPVKSATEISIRENRAQRNVSIDISRIINECPKQIFTVAAKILGERRLLSRDKTVMSLNTRKLTFEFESPLFDLQKQDDLAHFVTDMQIKQQYFGQTVAMGLVNLNEAAKFIPKRLNLPSELYKNDSQIQQLVDQMGQAGAAAAQGQPAATTTALVPQSPQASAVNI